ncbi:MAG: DoxX family membrane protein [Candidatus Korobacteraceae bacterium]
MVLQRRSSRNTEIGRLILAAIFVISGLSHFFFPEPFVRIVPPFLPWPKLLVRISGGAEILGGVGLLIRRCRRAAAYGLLFLLLAVFPANIYMAVAHIAFPGWLGKSWLQWLRLPLQIPLVFWALRYTRRETTKSELP